MEKACVYFFINFFLSEIVNGQSVLVYNGLMQRNLEKIELDSLYYCNYSFHFLLTTIGRRSLLRILESLKNQLEPQDYLTIVFDAKDIDNVLDETKLYISEFNCRVTIIFEEENIGYWGHGIRNRYADSLQGDFVLHCDDDNKYLPESIAIARQICQDKSKLYIFRINRRRYKTGENPLLYLGNIDTGSGVIPNEYNKLGRWEYFYGGDFAFYNQIIQKISENNIVFVDYRMYQIK